MGGIIHRNVYGGGSLASTGAPKIPPISIDGYRKGDTESGHGKGKQTLNLVNIKGGTIGIVSDYNAGYGGNVYGASRGQAVDTRFNDQASFATAIWTEVNVKNNPQIVGSVYGGGELGTVKQGVDVNISGGTILHDVYGGGAYASTNTSSSLGEDNKTVYPDTKINLTGGSADNVYGGGLGSIRFTTYGQSSDAIQPTPDIQPKAGNVTIELNEGNLPTGFKVNRIFGGNNLAGTPLGHIHVHVHATQNPLLNSISKKFPKTIITYNANNEELSKTLDYALSGSNDYSDLSAIATALELSTSLSSHFATLADENATQNAKETALGTILSAIQDKITTTTNRQINYDVQAVYGGGNLSAYEPTNIETEYAEVVVEGCDYTSIFQVYGGGNAASVPATKLTINETYEIYESFGGGNGADDFILPLNGVSTTFPNPGANVGYINYSHFIKENDVITVVEDDDANTKEKRQAKTQIHYGTGIAQTELLGGKIHRVYGGSNQKGNIRVEARSFLQDANDQCPVHTDKQYGGGKNAELDGGAHTELDCVHDVSEIYGGSENAHLYSDVTLNITNGTFQKVFGGNNTSGTIHGSITVNIKEEGCQPIDIQELYLGGYKAPYSIYGYYEDNNGQMQPMTKAMYDNLTDEQKAEAGVTEPFNDPRINIISATRIGTVYGGGYDALLVGSPHININMEDGRIGANYASKPENDGYTLNGDGTRTIPRGTVGTVFGGGNMADVDGNTYIEIGTGKWINNNGDLETQAGDVVYTYNNTTQKWTYLEYDNNGDVITDGNGDPIINEATVDPLLTSRKDATITGSVFGGGNQGDITGNTWITIANGLIMENVYGGGNEGSVGTYDISKTVEHRSQESQTGTPNLQYAYYDFGLSWPVKLEFVEGTGDTHIDITGGRIGTSGDDNGDVFGAGKGNISINWTDVMSSSEWTNMDWSVLNSGVWNTFSAADDLGKKVLYYQNELRYKEAYQTNVNNTYININLPDPDMTKLSIQSVWDSDDKDYKNKYIYDAVYTKDDTEQHGSFTTIGNTPCITGSVYGGAQDGHVIGDTHLTLESGFVGHALYGGGKGKGKYQGRLLDINNTASHVVKNYTDYNTKIGTEEYKTKDVLLGESLYSLTAGKVYGNTYIVMNGGIVMRNIFGGGNLGSVGKGNYSGGSDDYALVGYGEMPEASGENLWTGAQGTLAYEFTHSGIANITITDGTVGFIPPSTISKPDGMSQTDVSNLAIKDDLPTGNVFGGCRGKSAPNGNVSPRYQYIPEFFLGYVNETNVVIGDANHTPVIYGSVYGGGQDGHVRRDSRVTINNATIGIPYNDTYTALVGNDLTNQHWTSRGTVFGAGSGVGEFSMWKSNDNGATYFKNTGYNYSSGSVTRKTTVDIKGNTTVYNNVYGGGAIASVGPPPLGAGGNDAMITNTTYNTEVIISGNAQIGDASATNYGGNVFGASKGGTDYAAAQRTLYATDTYTKVSIGGGNVTNNVFGGGQIGIVKYDTHIDISGNIASTIIGNDVFGGGDQADVNGNTRVDIEGGHILHNVYGGGKMGSVGTIDSEQTDEHTKDPKPNDGALYEFALSWPVKFVYAPNTGTTTINITGGRIGTSGNNNGDVFGGGQGEINIDWTKLGINLNNPANEEDVTNAIKQYRYDEAYIANVRQTYVNVDLDYPSGFSLDDKLTEPLVYDSDDNTHKRMYIIDATYEPNTADLTQPGRFTSFGPTPCITGSVYGGAENGHVYEDTHVEITNGIIGHSLYGGGKGKGKFEGRLLDANNPGHLKGYTENIYSITAGKVYGNTNITMIDGYVMRSVFGGGNLGSVGKGNYAGGQDDYSLVGYGELPEKDGDNLWQSLATGDYADLFMNSGKTYVNIMGGQIGYILLQPDQQTYNELEEAANANQDALTGSLMDLRNSLSKKDDLITGNVFGGCRGQSSPNGNISPRYLYIPDFFLGYVNQTEVIIGTENGGPRILGSVYGGGQDGHVRRGTEVTVNNAEIGINCVSTGGASIDYASDIFGITDMNDMQWKGRGNVFGAGSGIGTYKIKDANGNNTGAVDYNYSSGSVTTTTKVTINTGAVIYQNVFGGGSLASVGPPNTGQGFAELNTTDNYPEVNGRTVLTHKSTSSTNIIINGGTVGHEASNEAGYGGNVFGAGRGNYDGSLDLGEYAPRYATTIWTKVEARNGHILGNVFGGGQSGPVTRDTKVIIGEKVDDTRGGNRSALNRNSSLLTAPTAAGGQQLTTGGEQPAQGSGGQTNAATQSQQNRTVTRTQAAP